MTHYYNCCFCSAILPQLSIHIHSHSRTAISIPKLHRVYSYSCGIPTGKWESWIPISNEDLY